MGGMGIDAGFGTSFSSRFIAQVKFEGVHLPIITLAYAAAILRKAGHEVHVIDQARQDSEQPEVLAEVTALKPDWVVAATSFAYIRAELQYLAAASRACGCKRLVFGATACHFASDIMALGLADVIAHGDPEVAIGHLAQGTLAPGLSGVLMAQAGSSPPVLHAAAPGFVQALDTVPWPDWNGFEIQRYGYFPLLKRRPFLTMLASRGCPYACSFCPYPVAQGAPFRGRSVKDVVAEASFLVKTHGIRSILFRDPTFSMDIGRAKDLARGLRDAHLDLDWGMETRLDRLDDELIDLLGESGCKSVNFGVDPIDEATREASHRRACPPDVAAARIARLERRGIATAGLFVIGLPNQSEDEMRRTIEWIDTLEMSFVNYELATPFPGTPLYDQAITQGWTQALTLQQLLAGDPKLQFNGAMGLAQMKALQDQAFRRFYAKPRRVVKDLILRQFFTNVRFFSRSALRFALRELRAA